MTHIPPADQIGDKEVERSQDDARPAGQCRRFLICVAATSQRAETAVAEKHTALPDLLIRTNNGKTESDRDTEGCATDRLRLAKV